MGFWRTFFQLRGEKFTKGTLNSLKFSLPLKKQKDFGGKKEKRSAVGRARERSFYFSRLSLSFSISLCISFVALFPSHFLNFSPTHKGERCLLLFFYICFTQEAQFLALVHEVMDRFWWKFHLWNARENSFLLLGFYVVCKFIKSFYLYWYSHVAGRGSWSNGQILWEFYLWNAHENSFLLLCFYVVGRFIKSLYILIFTLVSPKFARKANSQGIFFTQSLGLIKPSYF